jgi:hypothetical protein
MSNTGSGPMVSYYSRDCNASFLLSPSFWTWIEARPVGVLARCDRVCRDAQAFRRQTRYAPLILYTHKKMLTGLSFWLPEARLASELEKNERAYPRHLVILAGSLCQDDPAPTPSPSAPAGGILTRYQLFTPALITGLLLTFFAFSLSSLQCFRTREHPIALARPGAKGLQCRREKEPVREVGVMISCGLQ